MAKLEEVSQVNLQLNTEDIIELLGNIELLVCDDDYSGEPSGRVERELRESIRNLRSSLSHYHDNSWGASVEASSTVSISETPL